jgi:hypothetical protein
MASRHPLGLGAPPWPGTTREVRRPSKSSAAIARFAAAVREWEELDPREPFFVPFWWGLPEEIDTSPWWGDPNVQGWRITADDWLEPVSRARGIPPAMLVVSAQPRRQRWGRLRVR